jgi:hypothetical protein
LNNFAVGTATSPFLEKSNFGAFIFFGCITSIAVVYVIFLVPETKGRTLEEMDELFGTTGMAAADNERKVRIERAIGLLALVGMEPADEKREIAESRAEFSNHEEDVVADLKN